LIQALQKFFGEPHLKQPILDSSRRAAHKYVDLYNTYHYKYAGRTSAQNTRPALTQVKGVTCDSG
jgi:hypothetical protein